MFLANGFGSFDIRDHNQVPAATATEVGHAFPRYTEILARLGAGGNIQMIGSFKSGNFDFTPQDRNTISYGHRHDYIVALSSKSLVLFRLDINIKVSPKSAGVPGFALAL